MLHFMLRRILLMVPSLVGLLILSFVMIRLIPTDPAAALAGENATPEQVQHIRREYGFDRPIHEQFVVYLRQISRLDFGQSVYSRRPVSQDVIERLPATLELTLFALALSTLLGVPLGTIAAVHHNQWPDFALRIFSIAGVAVASFWFGIMMQLLFSLHLGWLPLAGRISDSMPSFPQPTGLLLLDSALAGRGDAFADVLTHLLLPGITLSLGGLATIARFTRAGVLDTLQKDFVTYERAVGYRRRRLVWIYVLRNSLTVPITQIGLLFGALVAGAVVVEAIFNWPGIGSYLVEAILTADYKAMLVVTLLVGVVYAAMNILVDLILGLIDPRVREQL